MEHDGPTYIRLFRKDGTEFFEADNYNFELFKADKLTEGNDVTIVAEGMLTVDAMRAVNELTKSGIDAELISVHTIKPLDEQTILQSARKTRAVLTVENGSVHGGLYGAVTELLSRECPTLCDAIAVYDIDGQVGELDELKGFYHMTTEDIVAKAKSLATKKSHR
ncbi:MAG: transketolase C-terminal domain-containing protein [Clostridia bacterium]